MRKKPRQRKRLKNAQTPQRQVHAVLGARINGTRFQIRKLPGCEVETQRAKRPDEKLAHIMTRAQATDQNHFCETIMLTLRLSSDPRAKRVRYEMWLNLEMKRI